MMSTKNPFPFVLALVGLSLTLSACLKTRSQLRDDSGEDNQISKPIPVQPVQEVHHGQYVIDELKEEMTRMEGRLEDLERAHKEASSKNASFDKEDLKKIEARLLQLEESQAHFMEVLKKNQESVQKDPNEVFKAAKAQMADENYEGAAETFGNYMKSPHPKHLQDAIFFRGECFFKLKQYKKAIVEYSKFPEKYVKSDHMPEALYKIGLSFDSLGMKDEAKGFYQELVEKFPKSPQAKKLRKKVK